MKGRFTNKGADTFCILSFIIGGLLLLLRIILLALDIVPDSILDYIMIFFFITGWIFLMISERKDVP